MKSVTSQVFVPTKLWKDADFFKFPARLIGSSSWRFWSTRWGFEGKGVRGIANQRLEQPRTAGYKAPGVEITQCSLLATDNFINISEGKENDIVAKLFDGHDIVVTKNRRILKCIKLSIILCGNLGIALRGHGEDDGNFSTENRIIGFYVTTW
ncbi:hypothetical protein MAR_003305 [Mya arenaria]|uniref:Uncharacterized protein n=1 Tax=Mya arenaria TaxID=6604 RepID=A0ABY7G5M0_MYAAR|nr:hypothetical protein MAR_003305 [Mya arenaria]